MSTTPHTTTAAHTQASGPGKMTLAMRAARLPPADAPKVLRVGLLESGRVRDERLVRRRETIKVGTREKNHLVLSGEDAPVSHELFALRGGRWFLELGAGMQARVTDGSGAVDVAPGGAMPLGDTSRGRVRIGDTTVLFQFVVAPPLATRPQLPAAARGNVVRSMDWLFTAFVAVSMLAHAGFVGYLRSADWPVQERWEYVPQDVVDFVMTPQPAASAIRPTPTTPDQTATAPDPQGNDDPSTPAHPQPRNPHPRNPVTVAGNDHPTPRLPPDVTQMGINGILGSLRDGPGAVANVLAGGHIDVDQDTALAQVRGVQQPINDGSHLRPQGGEPGPVRPVGDIGHQVIADQNIDTPDRNPETPVHGIARPGTPPVPIGGGGELQAADVRRVVNQALGGIKRCYERQLRNTPTLRGRIGVTFTVTGAGTVSGAHTTDSFDPTVGSCVVGVVSRLRFPEPEGGSVTFAFPFVFEPGQ